MLRVLIPVLCQTQRCTVEPPITDTPNSGHPPNNGRQLMYQLLFPLTQYIYSSRIADNLRIPDNGQVSRTERHFPIELRSAPPITDKGRGFVGGVGNCFASQRTGSQYLTCARCVLANRHVGLHLASVQLELLRRYPEHKLL